MILAHHGYGEELIPYVLAGGGGAGYGLLLVFRTRVNQFVRWLLRK
jgi:hypothetical protein